MSLGHKVLRRRAADYVEKYSPNLIGITGSWGRAVTAAAIAAAIDNPSDARVAPPDVDIVFGILGSNEKQRRGWMSRLARSKVKEATEEEPTTIVIEAAAKLPGDLDTIARSFPFSHTVVLNVHDERLEFFNRRELVAHEIVSIAMSLKPSGIAIINVDDPLLAPLTDNIHANVIGFGESPAADIQLQHIDRLSSGGFAVAIKTPQKIFETTFQNLPSKLHISCVLAALATVHILGEDAQAAARRLKQFKPPTGFLSQHTSGSGTLVFNDSAGATPQSMHVGLKLLAAAKGQKKTAILGDMPELGGHKATIYREIGRRVASSANTLVAIGDDIRLAQEAALESNSPIDTHHFQTAKDARKWLQPTLKKSDTILIAGEKEMELGKILEINPQPHGGSNPDFQDENLVS